MSFFPYHSAHTTTFILEGASNSFLIHHFLAILKSVFNINILNLFGRYRIVNELIRLGETVSILRRHILHFSSVLTSTCVHCATTCRTYTISILLRNTFLIIIEHHLFSCLSTMGPVVGEDSSAEAGGASNSAALKANSQEATAAGASTPAPDPGKATEAGDSSFIVNLVFPDPTDPVQLQVRRHLGQLWSCSCIGIACRESNIFNLRP